jgi:hypothetical protein
MFIKVDFWYLVSLCNIKVAQKEAGNTEFWFAQFSIVVDWKKSISYF